MTVTGGSPSVTMVTLAHLAEIPSYPPSCWCHVNCSFALMARRAGNSAGLGSELGRVTMRNALGLMLASVVAAVVIAASGWFYYSSRADQAAPKTVAARAADPLPAQAKLAAKDDVTTTATIAAKPAAVAQAAAPAPAPAVPGQQKQ